MSQAAPVPSGSRTPIARRTKIILAVVAVLVAIPLIALAILLTYDWNKARPWLNAKASEAIDRPFNIKGNLDLSWEKPSAVMAERDRTWRDLVPWPHLVANDVHVGQPGGMGTGDMASVKQFSFSLNPFSLLHKTIAIPVLRFDAPAIDLRRDKDGKNNWTFRKEDKPARWKLDLERVVFTKGVVKFHDAVEDIDLTADVDTVNADPAYGISWKLRGTYNNGPVSGGGKAGAVLSLKEQSTPYPVQADLRVGKTHIEIEGTITKPTKLAAVDVRLKLSGASMARLYTLTGLLLPETPAFRTEGRLTGELGEDGSRWVYDKFTGKVGSSDIAGHMEYQTGKPRGKLSGKVSSKLLQFADLGPLVGADSNASKEARGVEAVQPSGKVLPVESFRTERWTAIDADVHYAAERIVREKQLPISKLSTHLILKDGVLTLAPMNFQMAGGSVTSTIKLDGSGNGKQAIKATAKVSARHIKIKELFPSVEGMKATVGQINGDAQLSSTGNSVASLLGASNGEVKALIDEGTVSKMLLEQAGLNIGNIVLTKLFGDKQVKLNCMASDFQVTNGLMQTRTFVVDTEEAAITGDGTINLANEQMDLTLNPKTKGLRIFSLRSPLHLRGSFSKPEVSVDKGVLALKAGGAVALGLVAAPAALLPLVNTGPGQESGCARLLAEAREKPVAPPPGKSAPSAQNVRPRR
ncbi:AsmA family protein [Massilia violaceinigra]|uniref:AsmA family protein n=1 Tax=Massilia violaceinigra TaxID=2045208 RepID=A0ABY4A3E4_9BURK|nr:AsmA family protein [Massilia violaceinigra]UOD28091.1 AsmA family protein [Massilia violaceinigra]